MGWLATRWVPVVVAVAASAAGLGLATARRPEPTRPEPVALRSEGPVYRSLPELVDASAVVVLARVASASGGRTFAAPGGGAVRSRVLRLDVGAVLAGPDPGPTLPAEEVAELADGTPAVLDGLPPAQEGDQGFWFLAASADRSVPYLAAVGPQGRYLRRSGEPGDDRLQGATVPDPLVAGDAWPTTSWRSPAPGGAPSGRLSLGAARAFGARPGPGGVAEAPPHP